MKDLILIGANLDLIEFAEKLNYRVLGLIDNLKANDYYGYEILGDDSIAEDVLKKYPDINLTIIPDQPQIRFKLYNYYRSFTNRFESLISEETNISKYTRFGKGIVIYKNAIIKSNTFIGDFTRINNAVQVGNECHISEFCTLAPGVIVGGRCVVGKGSYLGTNATIIPYNKIGQNVMIGAGAVVTKDVPDNVVVVGNPARILKENKIWSNFK